MNINISNNNKYNLLYLVNFYKFKNLPFDEI
jgi:hypothetical protein